jgi:DNA repair protein RadA/Sms
MGRCNSCGEWNTVIEQLDQAALAAPAGRQLTTTQVGQTSKTKEQTRISAGVTSVDDVLGGGFVPGALVLVAGQPGIGKSTLLLQVAYEAAKTTNVLYISGEESVHQVDLRAKRLGVQHDNLMLASSTSADDIATTIASRKHQLVVVDSIQTIGVQSISSAIGSVSQITNSTHMLMAAAKASDTALLLVGHVTKEGAIAGPKVLEHVVDVVLQLEGDRYGGFKMLRALKNRFGSTHESAIFEMKDNGLQPVDNPSAALLQERQVSDGSVVLATIEGARPLLVEVQALVTTAHYGYPKRAASGVDLNRLNLLVAMLERRTKLQLNDKDIYINIVGGLKLAEPAADLAICMAIASAAKGMQLKQDAVVFGEVGLSGEVRRVTFADKRIAEAKKLGFKAAITPIGNVATKTSNYVFEVRDIKAALNSFLSK